MPFNCCLLVQHSCQTCMHHELAYSAMTVTHFAGRSEQKAQAAASTVASQAGSKLVHAVSADLGSIAQIRRLASQLQKHHPSGIHTLINNAGVL